jgi:glyoxylate/hydroxypyruvate reductase A
VLAAPLTATTRHFVNRERLSQCGGAYLMNVGRGALIDEAALPEALERGWIRGAALDVFATEPLPADSPLWTHPRVVVSPHVSGPSTIAATAAGFLECLAAFERGVTPRWVVAPESGY